MSATPEAPWVIHLVNGTRRLAENVAVEVEGVHYEPLPGKGPEAHSIFLPWHVVFEVRHHNGFDVQTLLERADMEAHEMTAAERREALEEASVRG